MSEQQRRETMPVKIMFAFDTQWIKLDDIIKWAKGMKEELTEEDYHTILSTFVRLKHQKPNK